MGESVIGVIRFRSLQAAMMDNGDAQRLERQDGATDCGLAELMLGQLRFFRYDLPKLVRGEMLVWSLDDADDTLDLGDQVSESLAESLAEEEGGVRAASYEGTRDCDSRGLRGKAGVLKVRCNCPRPFREGGGDIDFCCGDWKPSTCSEDNSASVSWGDRFLMASQKRCARAIRSVFGV
jgi:hypothetical protein